MNDDHCHRYGWEKSFGQKIEETRDGELVFLGRYMKLLVVMQTLWRATPLLCALATFATYTATGNILTAATAFTSLALFDLLQQPATNFPQVLTGVIDARE